MNAPQYIKQELEARRLSIDDMVELTRLAQKHLGLTVDGMPGPKTRAALEEIRQMRALQNAEHTIKAGLEDAKPLTIDADGWLVGEGVTIISADPSWYDDRERVPSAIVAHYSNTSHGTAGSMAARRTRLWGRYADAQRKRGKKPRKSSWHVSVEGSGQIVQMVPFTAAAFHCVTTPVGRRIVGGSVNGNSVGVEFIGNGRQFPRAQVVGIARLYKALAEGYSIPRDRVWGHSELDTRLTPSGHPRRNDPGKLWEETYASIAETHAYGE